jgi:hypothetical protein
MTDSTESGGDQNEPKAGEPGQSWPVYGQPGPQPPEAHQPASQPAAGAGQPYPAYGDPPPPGYGQQYPAYGQPYGAGQQYPAYGQPYGAGSGQQYPGYGQPYGAGSGQTGWSAAPQPGGIPLRPLALGDILNGAVTSARRNPAATFGLAAIVMSIYGVLTAIFEQVDKGRLTSAQNALSHSQTLTSQQLSTAVGNLFAVLIPLVLLTIVLTLVLNAALTGMLSAVIGRGVLGRKTSLSEARHDGRIGAVIGATVLLLLIGILVPAPVVVVVVVLALLHLGPVAVLLGVIGGIAGIVLEILLVVRLSMTLPAVVLERISPADAIRRSWQLTQGSFWRLFGILLLTLVIVGIAGVVLTIPFTLIEALMGGSGGAFGVAAGTSFAAILVGTIGSIVAATVTRPVSAGVNVLLYVDLRIRREGLDLRLRDAAQSQTLTGDEFAAAWQPKSPGPGQPQAW